MKMLSNTMNDRAEQLLELETFSKQISEEMNEIATSLGWTIESVSNVGTTFTCPYDESHQIPENVLANHLVKCQWKAEGYNEYDIPFSDSSVLPDAPSSIHFDEQLQDKILKAAKEQNPSMKIEYYQCKPSIYPCMGERLIPRTSDRLLKDFTREERIALYEYVIANTTKPDIGRDISDIHKPRAQESENKELTFLELLAQERNLKRRRTKHKGVHTNKKSHIEILREVINQQMEMYIDYVSEKKSYQEKPVDVDGGIDIPKHIEKSTASAQLPNSSCQDYSVLRTNARNEQYHLKHRNKLEYYEDTTLRKDDDPRKYRKRESHLLYGTESSRDYKRSRHRSRSSDRKKSHKKDKHRHKEDRDRKRRHKSRERGSSLTDKNRTKHKHHKRKERSRSKDNYM